MENKYQNDPQYFALIEKAVHLRESGRADESLLLFSDALKIQPDDSRLHAALLTSYSLALFELNNLDDAIVAIEKAIALEPDNVLQHRLAGTFYAKAKNYTNSRDAYHCAVILAPEEDAFRMRLAKVLIDLKRFDEAQYQLQICANRDQFPEEAKELLSKISNDTDEKV